MKRPPRRPTEQRIANALRECLDEIDKFLGACDEGEIRDSFRGLWNAAKRAEKVLYLRAITQETGR